MSQLLDRSLGRINSIRTRTSWLMFCIKLFRAVCLGLTMFVLWTAVRPGEAWASIGLGFLTFCLAIGSQAKTRFKRIEKSDFLKALEIKHPDSKFSPFGLAKDHPSEHLLVDWKDRLDQEVSEMNNFERSSLIRILSSLPIPVFCLALASTAQPLALKSVLNKVTDVVARLGDGATLEVVSGAPGDLYKKPMVLGQKQHTIELLMENMVEIKVTGPLGLTPQVDLRRRFPGVDKVDLTQEPYQSFLLAPIRQRSDSHSHTYMVAFSVKQDVDVYLSTVSQTTPVAAISVRRLPIPKIRMAVRGKLEKPWPDDRPLPLEIGVSAEHPLKQVRLIITAERRTSTEIVSNIMVTNKKKLSLGYDLLLETYVQSDLSRVEIVAEAVDRAVPIPLVGRSDPLVIETASAYGRYQQTLRTLRELKVMVDSSASNNKSSLDENAEDVAKKAFEQSKNSPFFDGLDRVQISSFLRRVQINRIKPEAPKVLELQELLNNFLYDHETLDDRERDRDFFVAARALSRLLEMDPSERKVKLDLVTERMNSFLSERQERWQLRVDHLPKPPKSWSVIRKKPFQGAMKKILEFDRSDQSEKRTKALNTLSGSVSQYRSWIDELEQAEESARRETERKRQEGLTSARNQLKDLQKRQGKISSQLDRAEMRNESDLAEQWPSIRALQNTNTNKTKNLEAQLRALSPRSSERVKAAVQAMQLTKETGNNQAFIQAESASDLAGRLLRQAQSAAQQSQSQRRRRERRRRVTGDNYYGRQVMGGDVEIKREYSVDRRYREEILDSVSSSKQIIENKEDAQMLEDYLRKIVR